MREYHTPKAFYLEGRGELARVVLLLIHGFAGTPSEFRRIGYYLNDLGYTVNGILLPGHGTTPEEMILTGWNDWYAYVRDSYDAMAEHGNENSRRIVAIGHSMGGLLALKLAMEREVAAVVSLAAPIFLTSRKIVLAILLRYFMKYVEKKPTAASHLVEEACAYSKIPLPCVVGLHKLLKYVKSGLSQVEAPVYVAQGLQDGLVLPRSADYIYKHVSSSFRRLAYYPDSSHGLLLDREREKVYEDISRFLTAVGRYGAWEQADEAVLT